MKIEFKPDQHYTTYSGWTYTWFLNISTKKEDFWLVSYEVMSLIIGFIFSLVLVIAISNKEITENICCISSHESIQAVIVMIYVVWLICSAWELYFYCDTDESREWKTFGKLEFAAKLVVRLVRGLPIIIGIIYLASLVIDMF